MLFASPGLQAQDLPPICRRCPNSATRETTRRRAPPRPAPPHSAPPRGSAPAAGSGQADQRGGSRGRRVRKEVLAWGRPLELGVRRGASRALWRRSWVGDWDPGPDPLLCSRAGPGRSHLPQPGVAGRRRRSASSAARVWWGCAPVR